MIALIVALVRAVGAGFSVFQQERAIYNSPAMVKNKLDIAKQEAIDAVRNAEAVTANPNATAQQHADALRQLREAAS